MLQLCYVPLCGAVVYRKVSETAHNEIDLFLQGYPFHVLGKPHRPPRRLLHVEVHGRGESSRLVIGSDRQ